MQEISFQPLKEEDLSLLYNWLNNNKEVKKWYTKKEISMERVKEKYIPYISGEKPTKAYIIHINKRPVGYIQAYSIDDYVDYKDVIQLNEKAAGLDLYIGDEDYLHKGLGSKIIKVFVKQFVFNMFEVNVCIIGPEIDNKSAIRSYEKAGFKHIKTVYNPEDKINEYLMEFKK